MTNLTDQPQTEASSKWASQHAALEMNHSERHSALLMRDTSEEAQAGRSNGRSRGLSLPIDVMESFIGNNRVFDDAGD